MAGNSGNWYKPTAGPIKGQAVYFSKAERGSLERADLLKELELGNVYFLNRVNASRPRAALEAGRVRALPARPPVGPPTEVRMAIANFRTGEATAVPAVAQGALHILPDISYARATGVRGGRRNVWLVRHRDTGKVIATTASRETALAAMATLNASGIEWRDTVKASDFARVPDLLAATPRSAVGAPPSAALSVPRGDSFDAVREAAGVIDTVHRDGALPTIPVKTADGRRMLATYWRTFGPDSDRADHIRLVPDGDHPQLTFAHEMGHFIDNQGFGTRKGFASEDDPRFAGFREAVGKSAAAKRLGELSGKRQIDVKLPDGRSYRYTVDRKYVRYVLTGREQFARAYAQYIAVKSKNPTMLAQLEKIRAQARRAPVGYPTQWEDDDFAPIMAEFDRVFAQEGWIT